MTHAALLPLSRCGHDIHRMGATGLLLIQQEAGKGTSASLLADTQDTMQRLYPESKGKCSFEYKLYRESESSRFLQYFTHSRSQNTVFCVLGQGDKQEAIAFDQEFDAILATKLGQFKPRSSVRGEGTLYEIDNFRIGVVSLMQQSTLKGVIVEVELLPCEFVEAAKPAIQDFWRHCNLKGVQFFGDRAGKSTALDTAVQYATLIRAR